MKKKSLLLVLLSFFCLVVLSSGKNYQISNASNSMPVVEFEVSKPEKQSSRLENSNI